jgi:hypothetical protein
MMKVMNGSLWARHNSIFSLADVNRILMMFQRVVNREPETCPRYHIHKTMGTLKMPICSLVLHTSTPVPLSVINGHKYKS